MTDEINDLRRRLDEAIAEQKAKEVPAFAVGDKVAWSHDIGPRHSPRSIVKRSFIEAEAAQSKMTGPRFGVVTHVEGPQLYEVELEPLTDEYLALIDKDADNVHDIEGGRIVLTLDELVLVED